MKKNWTNPELDKLNISETEGGTTFTPDMDDVVYDEEQEKYKVFYGIS